MRQVYRCRSAKNSLQHVPQDYGHTSQANCQRVCFKLPRPIFSHFLFRAGLSISAVMQLHDCQLRQHMIRGRVLSYLTVETKHQRAYDSKKRGAARKHTATLPLFLPAQTISTLDKIRLAPPLCKWIVDTFCDFQRKKF